MNTRAEVWTPPSESMREAAPKKQEPIKPAFPVAEDDLRSAFEEISAVVEKGGIDMVTPEKDSEGALLKKDTVTSTYAKPKSAAIAGSKKPEGATAKKPEGTGAKKPEGSAAKKPVANTDRSMDKRAALAADDQKSFLKMLYNTLMDNEVEERYVNQILENLDPMLQAGPSLDTMISSVYQKMVLMFGDPFVIRMAEKKPKVVFIIGPTGVGKTTTIAKLAAKFMIEKGKKVGLLTSDTYRIAATDQLDVYAKILNAPFTILLDNTRINEEIKSFRDMDLILVDTAGFSHRNQEQKNDLARMISLVDESYEKEIYLVLSATTKYHDLREIVDTYKSFTGFNIIFTKLDETRTYGNILNTKLYTGAELSYVTTGQNVPDDIEVIDAQKIVKSLLGGR